MGAACAVLLVLAAATPALAAALSFAPPASSETGLGPSFVAAGDLDGDGLPDLVSSNSFDDSLSVLRSNVSAPGTFAPRVDYPAPLSPGQVIVADMNLDGVLDLVVISCSCDAPLAILFGNASAPGTFEPFTAYGLDREPWRLVVADFNLDGLPDVAFSSPVDSDVTVLLGNISAPGSFLAATSYLVGLFPDGVAAGDFNNDGLPDLAVAVLGDGGPDGVAVLLGNSSAPGTFGGAVPYPTGVDPISVVTGDFNGDGMLDLAAGTTDGTLAPAGATVSVLLGNSSAPGTFGAYVEYAAGTSEFGMAAADLNGDGKLDLVVADAAFNKLRVLSGNGNGTFTGATGFNARDFPVSPVVADLDGDGRPDVAVASPSGDGDAIESAVTVLRNTATYAPKLRFSSAAYPAREGRSRTITVLRSNGLGVAVTVDYTTSDGSATEPGDYTQTSGTLSFGPTETSKTFTVPISDDTVTEDAETINLTLSNPLGGAVLAAPDTAVVTIAPNDVARVHFSSQMYAVGHEKARTRAITVRRTRGFGTEVTVQYATSDGTATAGEDYVEASGTLTFGPADTIQRFTVTLLNDVETEGAETVNLALSSPSAGAVLGVYDTAVLTIAPSD